MRRSRLFAALLAVTATACASGDDASRATTAVTDAAAEPIATDIGADTTTPTDTTNSTADSSRPPTSSSTDTSPPTSVIIGTAVGGNAGEVGFAANNVVAVIRNGDGTCSGWEGEGVPSWTEGLVDGAEIDVLDSSRQVIGTGEIGVSTFAEVGRGGDDQWECTFPFSATVTAASEVDSIRLPGHGPWPVASHPTRGGEFVVSVPTPLDASLLGGCSAARSAVTSGAATDSATETSLDTATTTGDSAPLGSGVPSVAATTDAGSQGTGSSPVFVSLPSSVQRHWGFGVSDVCAFGFDVARLERVCRPAGIAADHVVSVVQDGDPSVVLESVDVSPDPSGLPSDTAVVVRVASGVPCG